MVNSSPFSFSDATKLFCLSPDSPLSDTSSDTSPDSSKPFSSNPLSGTVSSFLSFKYFSASAAVLKKVSLEEIFLELTESEKKDKDASGKKSGKSFFKTAADAEKYLNEKNEDTVLDNGLEEKDLDESGKVSNDVSDNGLSGDKQDSFAASEKEKGEE